MTGYRRIVVAWAAALLCAGAFVASAGAQGTTNVTGTWKMTVQTPRGPGNPTFILKQDGEKLTGTYKGQLGEVPVTGTIKGNAVQMSFTVTGQGGGPGLQIEYAGTVEGDAMKGTLNLGPGGEGTFTGKKE
jgi:hypothetical protein